MPADEFEVIRTLLAPLARDAGARGLTDDAAVLDLHGPVVVTTDAIVEGVHFLADDPIEMVAMKALRVNVSDLVGKGAQPKFALLTLVWPQHRPSEQIARFARALGRDLEHYGMSLLGGDIAATPGPLTLSITAFGEPLGARTPARGDAKAGDDVWLVGGEIGSAWLGLELRTGRIDFQSVARGRDESAIAAEAAAFLAPDYLRVGGAELDPEAAWLSALSLAPLVRAECAPLVARFARASMDVSDGLVADAAKLASASSVAIRIEAAHVPLAIPAARWVANGGELTSLLTGGDDYVVLFTADPGARGALEAEAAPDLRLARIGRVEAGEGVTVVDGEGAPLAIGAPGFTHRLGR